MNKYKQRTKEWIEWKKGKIGGSDAPIIEEVSPYNTLYALWLEKVGLKDTYITKAMEHGNSLESIALSKLEEILGIPLIQTPDSKECEQNPWRIGSLDAISLDGKVIVEAKCPYKYENHLKVKDSKEIPVHHVPQLQHNLDVYKQAELIIYFSYVSDDDCVVIESKRNEEYQEKLCKKELDFYNRIVKFDPPESPDDRLLKRNDQEWGETAKIWLEAKKWEKKAEEARKKLIELSQGYPCIGGGITLKSSFVKGNVDYKKIPELQNVDLDQYRKAPYERWMPREI